MPERDSSEVIRIRDGEQQSESVDKGSPHRRRELAQARLLGLTISMAGRAAVEKPGAIPTDDELLRFLLGEMEAEEALRFEGHIRGNRRAFARLLSLRRMLNARADSRNSRGVIRRAEQGARRIQLGHVAIRHTAGGAQFRIEPLSPDDAVLAAPLMDLSLAEDRSLSADFSGLSARAEEFAPPRDEALARVLKEIEELARQIDRLAARVQDSADGSSLKALLSAREAVDHAAQAFLAASRNALRSWSEPAVTRRRELAKPSPPKAMMRARAYGRFSSRPPEQEGWKSAVLLKGGAPFQLWLAGAPEAARTLALRTTDHADGPLADMDLALLCPGDEIEAALTGRNGRASFLLPPSGRAVLQILMPAAGDSAAPEVAEVWEVNLTIVPG